MINADWLILNIDDDQAIRYVKTRSLQRAGFKVIEASSGYEGLDCVESHHPDLVLCDVKMADLNGLEVCSRIKERHPDILVLQVSASFVTPRDRVTGLDHGADSYLTEPVEPEELVAAVRALLRMKRAEDELRALNSRLSTEVTRRTRERDRIWTVSSELMAVLGPDGHLQSVNPAWGALLGYSDGELLARPFSDFVHEDDRAGVAAALDAMAQGASVQRESRLRARDDTVHVIAWTAHRDNDLRYALGRDVTEERAKAAELESAHSQLRQSQKMEALGQLTGGIAHDFNNLLTGILGSLDLIHRRIAKGRHDDLGKFVEVATSSARRAAMLTNRLLVFSRMQSLDQVSVDLRAVVAATEDLLRRTIGENVALEFRFAERLWKVKVDPNQLDIALLNLVLNSRDAMPHGGAIHIELANEHHDAHPRVDGLPLGDYVRVTVSDDGEGMSQEVMDKAFDPFFTTKQIGRGTGLGLSMVYGFAKQSHGHARIRSGVGRGTAIDLFLPRHAGDDVPAAQVPAVDTSRARTDGVILVTEDDDAVRKVVTSVLEELGYEVVVATTGEEAIDHLRSSAPIDLLITDIGLPGRSGIDVADEARVCRPDLKVLLMTGYADFATHSASTPIHRASLIAKPFDLDAFVTKVRECLVA